MHSREPLLHRLSDHPEHFEFFQAVRLLERLARENSRNGTSPARHPVGYDGSPQKETTRFRSHQSHSFPPAEVTGLALPEEESPDAAPPELTVACMGLTGPSGALPDHYTTLVIERLRARDYSLRDFLDLFNHRTISHFYRAWEKYRIAFRHERSRLASPQTQTDLCTQALFCLVGMGTDGLRDRLQVSDDVFLFYGGHFAHSPRSAASLEDILSDYLGVTVEIEQFVGQWLYLSEEEQSCMPSASEPAGLNCELGKSTVVGERIWSTENRFRIRFGPLSYEQFEKFLPTGDALEPICQIVRHYVGPEFDFDIQPLLRPDAVPWCRLGGEGSEPAMLGWNTWVRSDEFDAPVGDAVLSHEGVPSGR